MKEVVGIITDLAESNEEIKTRFEIEFKVEGF